MAENDLSSWMSRVTQDMSGLEPESVTPDTNQQDQSVNLGGWADRMESVFADQLPHPLSPQVLSVPAPTTSKAQPSRDRRLRPHLPLVEASRVTFCLQ